MSGWTVSDLLPGLYLTFLGACLAALLLAVGPKGRWGRAVPWLYCAVVAGELVVVHRPFVPPAPRRLAYPDTPVRFLQEHLGDSRMMGLGERVLPPNFYLMYGLADARVDNPSVPFVYSQLTWPLRREDPAHRLARPRALAAAAAWWVPRPSDQALCGILPP